MTRIAFLLERPSQFDAPLFRLASADAANAFEAWFLDPAPGAAVADPELGRKVEWGSDPTVGYSCHALPSPTPRRWRAERLSGLDLLIVNGYTRRPYLRAAWAARRSEVRTALRIDSVRFPGEPGPSLIKRLLVRAVLPKWFDRFLTTGSLGESFLRACGLPTDRIARFPYAVDSETFSRLAAGNREAARERWKIPSTAKVVLALTKFAEREAPWDLIEAARRLGSRGELRFLLAGDGPLRQEVERRVNGLDAVILPGYVPYVDLPSLYSAADLFVHPVQEERWGVSVAEALACGVPAITSDRVGAGHDLVVPGENGDRYRAGDAEELAAAIERALTYDRARLVAVSAPRLREFGLESTWKGLVRIAREGRA